MAFTLCTLWVVDQHEWKNSWGDVSPVWGLHVEHLLDEMEMSIICRWERVRLRGLEFEVWAKTKDKENWFGNLSAVASWSPSLAHPQSWRQCQRPREPSWEDLGPRWDRVRSKDRPGGSVLLLEKTCNTLWYDWYGIVWEDFLLKQVFLDCLILLVFIPSWLDCDDAKLRLYPHYQRNKRVMGYCKQDTGVLA